jgi:hypothetical protein
MLAPMTTACILIFPIPHPPLHRAMGTAQHCQTDPPALSGHLFTHSLHPLAATASRQAGINEWC